MRIGFLFDFGDRWDFDIQTEKMNVDSMIAIPQVLERHGEAPEQYPGVGKSDRRLPPLH
jgi:hypothetical protein